jgi:hypothetical protein
VPFGKYRGQPVEVMMADREWALAQLDAPTPESERSGEI